MRSMKKLLSSLLVVLLCLAFLAVPAYAEEGGEEPAYEAVDANGVQYPTLAAAFEAGGNITLAKDVTVGTTINVTIPTTLDLNGKTITSTVSGARLFEVSADFTINGNSGTITGNGAGYGAVRTAAGVTVNIIGGTYNYNTEEGAVFKGNATGSIFNISGATVSTNYWILTAVPI